MDIEPTYTGKSYHSGKRIMPFIVTCLCLSSSVCGLISSASGAELTSSQTVKISNQKLEFADLHLRIKNAGITKIHIVNLKKGTLRNTMGIDSSKLLVWNGAGRRLFSTMTDAHSSGFVVWEFNPGSLAEKELDEQLKLAGKRYSDDLLYIMWDGLEFQVD